MSVRTTRTSLVFDRPFALTGVDARQPAGVYIVETDEEPIENLSFLAYRRIATRIFLADDPLHPGIKETITIDPAEIDAVLAVGRPNESMT